MGPNMISKGSTPMMHGSDALWTPCRHWCSTFFPCAFFKNLLSGDFDQIGLAALRLLFSDHMDLLSATRFFLVLAC